jgi:hypothetical protein
VAQTKRCDFIINRCSLLDQISRQSQTALRCCRISLWTSAIVRNVQVLACNNHKGPKIAGVDPVSRALVGFFNPRRHKWSRHFRWDGPILGGLTPIGRATATVLEINLPFRVALRQALIQAAAFPPRALVSYQRETPGHGPNGFVRITSAGPREAPS